MAAPLRIAAKSAARSRGRSRRASERRITPGEGVWRSLRFCSTIRVPGRRVVLAFRVPLDTEDLGRVVVDVLLRLPAGSADLVFGSAGDDELAGGGGDDALFGAAARDRLSGGSGLDACIDGERLSSCESLTDPFGSQSAAPDVSRAAIFDRQSR
jgi:hypothetical protein